MTLDPTPPALPEAVRLLAIQDTMEDYTQTVEAPLKPDSIGRFAVVQSSFADTPEVLSVDSKGGLVHVHRDPLSQSGWRTDPVPVPRPPAGAITGITAFYRGEHLHAFLHYQVADDDASDTSGDVLVGTEGRAAVMVRSPDEVWTQFEPQGTLASVFSRFQQLGVHLDASGERFLFGITRGFGSPSFFVVRPEGERGWAPAKIEPILQHDTAYHLLGGFKTDELVVLRCNGPFVHYRRGRLQGGRFEYLGDTWERTDPGSSTLTPTQIVPLPAMGAGTGAVHFLLLNDHKRLTYSTIHERTGGSSQWLSGGTGQPSALDQIALSVDTEGVYTVFVLNQDDQRLWVVRQDQTAKAGTIRFRKNWDFLGDALATLGSAVALARGPEFFAVDLQHRLLHSHQPQVGDAGVWHTAVLETPQPSGAEPERCTTHTMELTAVDATGSPVPNTTVHLEADRVTPVYVGGITYQLAPGKRVPVQADVGGRVTVRVPCAKQSKKKDGGYLSDGLTAPVLTASLGTEQRPRFKQAFAPDLTLYARLADEQHISGESLRESPLVDKTRIDAGTAETLAAMTRKAGRNMLERFKDQDPDVAEMCAEPFVTEHWSFNFPANGGIVGGSLTADEYDAVVAAAKSAHPEDIGRAFGDFFRWIASQAKAFTEIVVKIARDVVELVVDNLPPFVLKIGKEIGQFLEGMFKRIGEAFGKFVDAAGTLIQMLEALMSWEDIKLTKDVLKGAVSSLMSALEKSMEDSLPQWLEEKFAAAEETISTEFARARAGLGSQSMVDLAAGSRPGGTNPFDDTEAEKARRPHAARSGYVARLLVDGHGRATITPKAAPMSAEEELLLSSIVDEIKGLFQSPAVDRMLASLLEAMQDVVARPEEALRLGLNAMLSVFEGVVNFTLETVRKLLVLLLRGGAVALRAVRNLLEGTIEIPLLSAIYHLHIGSELSLLDLGALVMAAPATILYKVLRPGKGAPFEPRHRTEVPALMSRWGDLRRVIEGPAVEAAGPEPQLEAIKAIFGVCGACLTPVNSLLGAISDGISLKNTASGSPGPGPGEFFLAMILQAASLLDMALSWPMGISERPADKRTPLDWFGLGTWIAGLGWTLLNSIFVAVTKSDAKWVPYVGPILTAVAGVINLILGIVETILAAVEGSAQAIAGGVRSIVSGWIDANRVFIIGVKAGKFAPLFVAWVAFNNLMGGLASFVLQLLATFLPDDGAGLLPEPA